MYAGFIYEWINIKNGMKYLGSHKGTITDNYTGSGKRFLNAVRKHGIETFERHIIEYISDEQNIFLREQYHLDERNCAKSKKYYNISPSACGGNTGNGKQISKTHKKAFANGERNPWNKGLCMSEDQKNNLRVDVWEIVLPSGEEIVIKNMLEFCRQNKLNPSSMSAVARGKRGHYKEYRCKKLSNNRKVEYEYQKYTYLTDAEKKKINSESVKKAKQQNAMPKIKYDGIIYNSLVDAMNSTKLSRYLLIKRGELLRSN
jgi:hypothetical protein